MKKIQAGIFVLAMLLALLLPFKGVGQLCPPSPNGVDCGVINPTSAIIGSSTICASSSAANRTIVFNYTTAIVVDQICIDFGDNNSSTITPTGTSISFTHTYSYPQTDFCPHGPFQPPVIFNVVANFYKFCNVGGTPKSSFDQVAQQFTVIYDPRPKIANITTQCLNDGTCVTIGACTGNVGNSLCSCTNAFLQQSGSYTWDFGDGTSQTFTGVTDNFYQDICHPYADGGTYTITLTATNYCGTKTDSKPNLHFVKVDSLAISGGGYHCTGDLVTLNLLGSGSGGGFLTSATGPLPLATNVPIQGSTTATPSMQFSADGMYRVRVSYGACAVDSIIEILPGVNMRQDTIPDDCFSGSYSLDLSQYYITSNPNQTNTAIVSDSNGQIWSGGLSTVNLTHTGTYTVAVVCSTSCNTANYSQSFTLNDPVNLSAPPDTIICLQDTFLLPNIAGTARTPAVSDTFVATAVGSYPFVYTPSCGNAVTLTVTVQGTAAYCTDQTFCADPAMITLTGTQPNMTFSGTYVSNNTMDGNAAGPGSHDFYSTYTSANCTFKDIGTITILDPWSAAYLLDDIVCANSTVNFVNNTTVAADYTINWGDGITDTNNPTHTYSSAGTYYDTITFSLGQCNTIIADSVVVIAAPDATFVITPDTLCHGNSTTIQKLQDPLYSYQWTYDSNPINTPVVIVASNTTDTIAKHTVGLQVSSNYCSTVYNTLPVYFYPATKAILDLKYDSVCSPLPVIIINNSTVSSTGATYQLFKNGALVDSTDVHTHLQYDTLNAYTSDTTYTFLLIVYSCGKYDTAIRSITVHPVDFTPAIYTPNFSPCRFALVEFTSSVISGCTVAYNFGDGITTPPVPSNTTITHAYANAGDYTVGLTMYCACKSKSDNLTIHVQPGPDLTDTVPSDTCNNRPITITSHATGTIAVASYDTYFGDGDSIVGSSNPNPTHVYTTAGIYNGWMLAHGTNGCNSNIAPFTVNIHETPSNTLPVSDTFACSSILTLLSINSSAANSTYQWTMLHNSNSIHATTYDGTLPFYADDIGEYFVSVTAFNNSYPTCAAVLDNFQITVYQSPTAFFTVEPLYVKGELYFFQNHNKSTPANNTYLWSFGDNSFSHDITPEAHGYKPGDYLDTLVAYNGPCTDTAVNPIHVNPYLQIFAPNVFTPNNDGVNDCFEMFGNTHDIDFLHVMVFDRIGEKVFDSYNINFKWDGVYKDKPLAPAVFVYTIEVSALDDPDSRLMKGTITLIK